jgi:hypothetical protein
VQVFRGQAARAAFVALLVFTLSPIAAQVPVPVGVEFQVTTYTTSAETPWDVAVDADGDFVVVWGNGSFGIFGRRFSSAGTALGSEFQVSTYPAVQSQANVDMNSSGAFVVAWDSQWQDDGVAFGFFARRFNSAGAALDVPFQVNTTTVGTQGSGDVAIEDDGDFVAVWSGAGNGDPNGVFLQRFSSSGARLATEFIVPTNTGSGEGSPTIDIAANGNFVVAWNGADADGLGVSAQRFDSSGARIGPEFPVNAFVAGSQIFPSIGLDGDGDFAVAWESLIQDSGTKGVFTRWFDSNGTPGAEHLVNTYATGSDNRPQVAVDHDGDFVVVWDFNYQDVFGRRFKRPGVPTTAVFPLNSVLAGAQTRASVGADRDGDFVVAFESPDGNQSGAFARRFDVPMIIDVDGNGAFGALTDGLLILRYGFGFTGATLTTGAVGPGCTRCDPTSITAFLESLL